MKKVLVSGGSSGIGRGIAVYMASQGWEVAFTYNRNAEGAQKTREIIESAGGTCHVIEAHLQNEGAPEAMVREAVAQLGGLDAYVCNAGRDGRHSILSATRHIRFTIDFLKLWLIGNSQHTCVHDTMFNACFYCCDTKNQRSRFLRSIQVQTPKPALYR